MYKYELHMHTSEGSACGKSSGAEMVDFYAANGYAGMVVTDHFYHGNTAPDRALPWQTFVKEYANGYYSAKKAAEGKHFEVFFGVEVRGKGSDEYIILGPSPEWYADHPELRDSVGTEFLSVVRGAGAFVIHAHPYRERSYMLRKTIPLFPDYVDAIEVRNCGNLIEFDRRALEYARELDLPMTGGSDNHNASITDPSLSGIALPSRVSTLPELIDAIRERKHTVIDIERVIQTNLTPPTFAVKRV